MSDTSAAAGRQGADALIAVLHRHDLPDSHGLDYTSQACIGDVHTACPAWWSDRSGGGTRCQCSCHDETNG